MIRLLILTPPLETESNVVPCELPEGSLVVSISYDTALECAARLEEIGHDLTNALKAYPQ